MASRARVTAARKSLFLEEFSTTANVSEACARSGMARFTVYRWRKRDPSFAQGWVEALEHGIDPLVDEALRRAVHGRVEPVFYKGEECGSVHKHSDALLMFMLRARRPKIYKNRAAVTRALLAIIPSGAQFDLEALLFKEFRS